MHAVPPPMIGNYMPSGPDREEDDFSVETLESVPEPVVVEPKVVSQHKVWSDAPIIEHQELASLEQTVSGKDFSNPLIVDSLLKTIWFINAPCFCNEALAIPGQTATSKELSNSLMAGSLPKTTLPPKLLE
ncbi:hypothetical protein Tco_1511507, partial [Tanacetum coccineum]